MDNGYFSRPSNTLHSQKIRGMPYIKINGLNSSEMHSQREIQVSSGGAIGSIKSLEFYLGRMAENTKVPLVLETLAYVLASPEFSCFGK